MKRSAIALVALALVHLPLTSASLAAQDPDAEQVLQRLLRRADDDGDGRVSREEFPGRAQRFRRLDRNGDGYLDRADLAGATPAPSAPPESDADAPEPTPEEAAFFEKEVRPLLAAACYRCHSPEGDRIRGGLRVDSRAALLAGGASGPAIVPGDVEASLLIEAVRRTDEDFVMPPKEALDADEVAVLERWVALGAPWPGATAAAPAPQAHVDYEAGRAWWCFQPVVDPAPPEVARADWPLADLDRFVLAELEARDLAPVGDADDLAWLRRVHLDLAGLPPTPAEADAFLADRDPERYARVVDALLASPRYGERWGRHWLDAARYAESSGRDTNVLYPHAWRYRDYVIDAFDRDLAYDRFLVEQLAGDLLPAEGAAERARLDVATGYLALGAKSHSTQDRRQFAADVVDEQLDALTQGVLGLTVACARCHDHKFDPVAQRDYYAMAGILGSTETLFGTLRGPGNRNTSELRTLSPEADAPLGAPMAAGLRTLLERQLATLERNVERARDMEAGDERDRRLRQLLQRSAKQGLEDLLARFDEDGRPTEANLLAMGARDGRGRDAEFLVRGEVDQPGERVPRGVPGVFVDAASFEVGRGSGRLELARWIAAPENPLTARVWANRVWMHLFGRGIVTSPNNFGRSGDLPSHPALLDHLASRLVAEGWSTKALVRYVVLSRTYRLAARDHAQGVAQDPDAVWLWRYPDRRLDAEVLRDSMLFAAGMLDLERPVGSVVGTLEGTPRREEVFAYVAKPSDHRSVYLPVLRDRVAEALEVFDAADPSFVSAGRDVTTVATQALYLLNDEEVLAASDALARRLQAATKDRDERIELAFRWVLGRAPEAAEQRAVRAFLKDWEAPPASDETAAPRGARARARERARAELHRTLAPETKWAAFAQSLFLCAEFRYAG